MARNKDEPCSRCGTLMWWHSRASRPRGQNMCRPCRKARNAELAADPVALAGMSADARYHVRGGVRTFSVADQQRAMELGRLTERDKVCSCGRTFRGNCLRLLCDHCRASRLTHRNRKKNAVRQNRGAGRIYLDTGELITISSLGDRDKWTCWLCNEFVNRALGNRDPWMPSFDHVQPISLGGLDSWDNLRLAHLTCNIKRGNRVRA